MGNRSLANSLRDVMNEVRQQQSGSLDETIYIDVDDILNNFGQTLVYRDIIDRKRGFGSMAKVYTMLVHPVITELFNDAVNCEDDALEENLREMVNTHNNDKVADFIYDSVTSKLREYLERNNNMMEVRTESVVVFAISMIDILVSHIRNYALDFRDRIRKEGKDSFPGYVLLNSACSAHLEPDQSFPSMLSITVTYTWVNLA